LREDGILTLIFTQTQKLTGAQDLYIALYDESSGEIRFPIATEKGKPIIYPSRKANMEKRGKTDEIIFTRKSILHKTLQEGKKWYSEYGHAEFIGHISPSWLGVPMIIGEKILGVIAAVDLEKEFAYDELHLEVLSSMSSQAAIALDNARLYYGMEKIVEERTRQLEDAQEKVRIADVNKTIGLLTAEIAHKVGNAAGKIKFLARERFQDADNLTDSQKKDAGVILRNVEDMIKATNDLFKPFEAEPKAVITIVEMMRVTIGQCACPQNIEILAKIEPDLTVNVQVTKVQSYLTELLNNALKYAQKGIMEKNLLADTVEIVGRRSGDGFVEILFTNHGPAIPLDRWESIFRAFSGRASKSDDELSFGLGLWGTRTTMQEQGGTALVLESNELNTTFMVRLLSVDPSIS
jgi:signal transduction histidine kinase